MKTCTRCKQTKDYIEFNKRKTGKDGLNAWCKSCVKIDNQSRKGRYKEREKEYRKTYSQKPDVKERRKQQYQRDKEQIRLRTQEHYWSLNGQINQYIKSAKKRNLNWDLTQEDCKKYYNTNCTYCGEYYKGLGIDRVDNNIGYDFENSVPCCFICNTMKRTLSKEEFILKIQKIWENIENWREI